MKSTRRSSLVRRTLWASAWAAVSEHGWWGGPVIWTLLLGLSLGWNIAHLHETIQDLALVAARASFEKDVLFRQWAANHGGVYVPVTDQTPPNPYLSNLPERDITTPSGRLLTLMNPAYITRQLYELGQQINQHSGHITSLNPIRPANAPDDWERQALEAFERGTLEVSTISELDGGEPYLRLMRPLVTTASCLRCHAAQGYHEGDIRGGISVTVPMREYEAITQPYQRNIMLVHGGTWGVGLILILAGLWQAQRRRREREQALAALRHSEARFRSYFELPLTGRAITSPHQGWVEMNSTLCDLLGYTPAELRQMTWPQLTHPDDLAADLQQFERVMAGEIDGYTLEKRFIRKDGQVIHTDLAVQCLRRPDRSVDYFVTLVQNITDRKRAEEALRASEEWYRAVVEDQTETISRHRSDNIYTFVNEAFCRLFGQTPAEFVGRAWQPVAIAEDRPMVEAKIRTLSPANPVVAIEHRVSTNTGEVRWMQFVNHGFFDERGKLVEVQAVGRDITDRKRAEAALHNSKNQINQLLQTTDQGIYGIDLNGCCTFINQAGLTILGYSFEACLGRNMHDLIHHSRADGSPYPVEECPIFRAKQTGVGYRLNNEVFWRNGGTPFPAEYSSYPVLEHGEIQGAVVTFSDITERKQAEAALHDLNATLEQRVAERTAELQMANVRLTELDHLKDDFLSRISHELRTPLTSILLSLELLEIAQPDKRERYLQRLKASADRMRAMIEDVLMFSQLNLYIKPELLSPINLNDLVAVRLETWRKLSTGHDLRFQLDLTHGLPHVRTDGELIGQAVHRLVINAIHYTPAGTVTISTALRAEGDQPWVTISVQDTGPGITPEDLPHIFERFYRGRAAADYKTPGTGIGLSISREIIEKLGGRLTVETQVGVGSTFILWLKPA